MEPFEFKQFTIQQDRCAMKVGTDGVLLGAWVSVEDNPLKILDIGAGTGLIALQIAQRCDAEIDAVEIDENAFEQCVDNFENSDWGDRLFCYHASFQEFVEEMKGEIDTSATLSDRIETEIGTSATLSDRNETETSATLSDQEEDNEVEIEKYNLIVSNPPFYSEDYKTQNNSRDLARFQDALPFDELIEGVAKLLAKNGKFAIILPRKEEENFIQISAQFGLFPIRICRVKGSINSEEKRTLLEFSSNKILPAIENLTIEISRHQYTSEYIALVRDFYSAM